MFTESYDSNHSLVTNMASRPKEAQYLDHPDREKHSDDGTYQTVAFGSTAMQGYRVTMDDELTAVPLDEHGAFFGVFDGHGGREVARYVASMLPKHLKKNDKYQEALSKRSRSAAAGLLEEACKEVYMEVDNSIATDEGIQMLRSLENPWQLSHQCHQRSPFVGHKDAALELAKEYPHFHLRGRSRLVTEERPSRGGEERSPQIP